MNRRQLVAGAAGLVVGGLLLGGGADPALGQGGADVSVVLGGVQLERALSVAYTALAGRPRLGRELQALLGQIAEHEARHAQSLLTLAEYLGGLSPPMPTLPAVELALPSLRRAVDRASTLAVVEELERAELLGFNSDVQVLDDAKLIQIVGAVMCSDAQHLVLVRQAAGLDPIPSAFETGNVR